MQMCSIYFAQRFRSHFNKNLNTMWCYKDKFHFQTFSFSRRRRSYWPIDRSVFFWGRSPKHHHPALLSNCAMTMRIEQALFHGSVGLLGCLPFIYDTKYHCSSLASWEKGAQFNTLRLDAPVSQSVPHHHVYVQPLAGGSSSWTQGGCSLQLFPAVSSWRQGCTVDKLPVRRRAAQRDNQLASPGCV